MRRVVVLAVSAVVAVLALAGCSMPAGVSAGGPVRFEVTGTGTAQNVTYGVNGKQSQEAKARLPWSKDVDSGGAGFSVASLVAQNGGSGSISCKITRGGDVIAQQTSNGQYAVVTCSG